MSTLADASPAFNHRKPLSPSSQSLPPSPHHRPPPPAQPLEHSPIPADVSQSSHPAVRTISSTSLNEAKGAVIELRFVLPASAVENHKGSWNSSPNLPQLQAFDPIVPTWLAEKCGGCCRIHVARRLPKKDGPTGVHRQEYACALPFLPASLVVSLDTAAAEGDCQELNALRFKPETLIKRTCVRLGDDGHESSTVAAKDLATVYCHIAVQIERRGITGIFFWPVLPLVRRWLHFPVRTIAKELLSEHFRCLALRHSSMVESSNVQGEMPRKLSFGTSQTLELPVGTGNAAAMTPDASARNASALGSTSPEPLSPAITPRVNELAFTHPSLTKGMPFYNGYLYKLGDGILNRGWNLRYFLLIGPTLHYFLSPHEAKPRDVFNLKGAIVQWIKDQTRPFAFTVTFKDGQQRPLQLSGEDWKDTQEWIDRIQAAGKISLESQDGRTSVASSRRRPSKTSAFAAEIPIHENSLLACAHSLQASVHSCQLSSQGCCLRELHNGLRIFERESGKSGPSSVSSVRDAKYEACCCLLLVVLVFHQAGHVYLKQLLTTVGVFLFLGLSCLIFTVWYFLYKRCIPDPIVFASTRIDCPLEELRDILAEPSFYADWQPDHSRGRFLSLWGDKDEVLLLQFYLRYGLFRRKVQFQERRRWIRGENGARLLCAVAESDAEQKCAGVEGCEGFAVVPMPGEDNSCMVVWQCGLRLATWAPHWLRKRFAVQRVSALAGLRDWVSCGRPQTSRTMQSVARELATTKDPSGFSLFLRGFQCAASGSLYAAADLERAAVMTTLLCEFGSQMLRSGKSLTVSAVAHGLLPHDGLDIAHCYAARWAYASTFLPAATTADQPRDRMLQVVAFAVAGLHLAAASFPYFPWMPRTSGAGRYTAQLPNDVNVRIEPQAEPSGGSFVPNAKTRSTTFEAKSNAGLGYRIYGTDEVACSLEFPSSLRFSNRGVTIVDLSGGNAVRYRVPDLRVRASSWSLGRGSVYEWLGPMHFVDVSGNFQCDLSFGGTCGDSDSIFGSLRDCHGVEVGRIRGSWLGPLLCDNQVLWRGPRLQPPVS